MTITNIFSPVKQAMYDMTEPLKDGLVFFFSSTPVFVLRKAETAKAGTSAVTCHHTRLLLIEPSLL